MSDIDARHQRRIEIMQRLFALTFTDQQAAVPEDTDPEAQKRAEAILAAAPEIDALLQTAAPERPISEINQVDLAILRLSVFESQTDHTPVKVIINEAIELAKEFGTDSSSAFVNAVLGSVLLDAKKHATE